MKISKVFFFLISFLNLLSMAQGKVLSVEWYHLKRDGKIVGYMNLRVEGLEKKKAVYLYAKMTHYNSTLEITCKNDLKTFLPKEIQISDSSGRSSDGSDRKNVTILIEWKEKDGKLSGEGTLKEGSSSFPLPFKFTPNTYFHPFHFFQIFTEKKDSSFSLPVILVLTKLLEIPGKITYQGKEKIKIDEKEWELDKYKFEGTYKGRAVTEEYWFNDKGTLVYYIAPNKNEFTLTTKESALEAYKNASEKKFSE